MISTPGFLLLGCAYVTGGVDKSGEATSSCEMFDPEIQEWKMMRNMIKKRVYHGMVSVNGEANGSTAMRTSLKYL